MIGAVVELVSIPFANLPFEASLTWLGLVLLKARDYPARRCRS
jgi:hypothetical protein